MDRAHAAGIIGAGQLIAIVDAFDNPYAAGDVRAFDSAFGLRDPVFNVYNLGAVAGSAAASGWDHEIDLDVEWVHAAAPGASIALVETPNDQLPSLLLGVDYAVNTLGADVVSMSWGIQGEFAGESAYDTHFPATTPAGKPVMYAAAAGDTGFGISWPAVSPGVLGVGGTRLAPSAVGNDTQFTHYDCAGMTASPGVTPQNETVWGAGQCTGTTCNGTGGGTSTMEPKPAWQAGYGPSSGRSMPDVAMLADPGSGVALYSDGSWSSYMWGGTSLATPLWAGVIALVNQQRRANGAANLNVTSQASWVYQVSALNDIVTGSSPSSSSDTCLTTGACVAAPGYDQVTGRGSPLASGLVGLTPWELLGGTLTSSPAATSSGLGRLDVFGRGTDNALWHKWRTSSWSDWEFQGGSLTSEPAVVAWAPNRLDLFVRGPDNALWHKWWDGRSWSGWEYQGGALTSGPAVSSWASNRLDVFVRGTDNALWHKSWDGSSWSGWEPQQGILTSSPGAVSWTNNRIDVFVRGTDNALWHKWWDGNGWSGWERQDGSLSSAPAASSKGSNRLDLFVRWNDNALWRKSWNGSSWSNWTSVGGQWATGPAAVSQPGAANVDVFEVGPNRDLQHASLI